jgi:predicted HicB family RNase H-like nuclease
MLGGDKVEKEKTFLVNLDESTHKALKMVCIQNDISMQAFIQELIKNALEEAEEGLGCGN